MWVPIPPATPCNYEGSGQVSKDKAMLLYLGACLLVSRVRFKQAIEQRTVRHLVSDPTSLASGGTASVLLVVKIVK